VYVGGCQPLNKYLYYERTAFSPMRFKEQDIYYLMNACKVYQDQTGSEYMWEQYDDLIQKLKAYKEEYISVQGTASSTEV